MGKRWKLTRDVPVGDPAFDRLVHVDSDAPDEQLEAVLQSPEARHAVRNLLERGHEPIGVNTKGSTLAVDCRTAGVSDEKSLARLVEQLQWLIEQTRSLNASLPLFVGDTQSDRRSPWFRRVLLLEMTIFLLGIIASMVGDHHLDGLPDLVMLGMAVGAWALFVPLAWWVAHGRSRGVTQFLTLVLSGLVVFPVGVLGLGTGSNTILDSSPPQEHHTDIVDKPRCTDKNNSVEVRDWRDPRAVVVLSVQGDLCRAVEAGDELVLVVRAGFWGWEWLSDIRVHRTRSGTKRPRSLETGLAELRRGAL